jgi:hypothetical protein
MPNPVRRNRDFSEVSVALEDAEDIAARVEQRKLANYISQSPSRFPL